MSITTASVLSPPVKQTFSYRLLSTPIPNMIHKIPAIKKSLARKGGTTLRMRRYNNLPTAKVPLGNTGVEPPPVSLSAVNIDAKVDFYGMYTVINEQVTLQAQDPVLNEAALKLGVSLRQTEDELTRDVLASTASFINCTGGVNGDNPTEIKESDVNTVVSTLMDNDAKTIFQSIEGQDKFGTAPVRDAFFALGSTKLIGQLENAGNFIHKNQYPAPTEALPSEWGAIGNLRFLLSSIGSFEKAASANSRDVYNIFCVGMEAYACVEQDGYSAEFIYRPPIYSGPLALNATAGYKFAEVPKILQDLHVIRLRTTKRT